MQEKNLVFYDTWPDIKNAEKENLMRFEISCKNIGVGFITISNDGYILNIQEYKNIHIESIDKNKIIAVISLHHRSPKNTNLLTISALWNPESYLLNDDKIKLLKSDYFVSCYSTFDGYIENNNKQIIGYLNHSVSQKSILNYSFGQYKCFYVGINWEKCCLDIFKERKNILNLLKYLERKSAIHIYGPKYFHNINVWEGFNSYSGEIEFDGISAIKKINDCGICLVLSSEEHKKNKICSNRLFEGIAAGVPLICDENEFIKNFFGNNVFYINLPNSDDVEKECDKIISHIEFIKNNENIVLNMINNCRKIFFEYFELDNQIKNLIESIALLK